MPHQLKTVKVVILFLTFSAVIGCSESTKVKTLKQPTFTSQDLYHLDSLITFHEKSRPDSAVHFLEIAIDKAQNEQNEFYLAKNLNRLAYHNIYTQKDQTSALENINRAIKIAETKDDFVNQAEGYKLLAVISIDQNIGNTLELINKAIDFAQRSNSFTIEKDCYEIKTGRLISIKKYNEAEETYKTLLELCEKQDIESWFTNSLSYGSLLEFLDKKSQAQDIYKNLDRSKHLLTQSKGYFVHMNDLGTLATKLNDYNEAEQIFQTVLNYELEQPKVDTFHLSFIYRSLSSLYEKQKNYEKAFENTKKWTECKLWLNSKRQTQDSQVKMTQLKATLDLEKKEIEIDFLEKEKEEQLLLLLGALAILTILTVSFIFVSRSRKKLKLQRKQLESLNATKDKLFTILSHDLRSPVANLQSNISLMNLGALSQEEFSQSVKELGGEVQNVNGMLENMLFWATTQMGGIKARSSVENVHELLRDQFNLSKNIAKQKDISLLNKLPKELKIKVDVNHFRIILRNIIHNAIKFTPAGGFIEVSFEKLDAQGLIKIKDSGIGMSPQEINQLFDFGARNNKAGTNLETGTGVGLVLVKELIDLNGLELKVESQIGEGTVFTIVFPFEKE